MNCCLSNEHENTTIVRKDFNESIDYELLINARSSVQ